MKSPSEITRLIWKYRAGTATEEEVRYLLECIHTGEHTDLIEEAISQGLLDPISDTVEQSLYLQAKFDRLYKEIDKRRKTEQPPRPFHKRNLTWLWYAAAAIALIVGSLFYTTDRHLSPPDDTLHADIRPGRDQATLTLADGSTLELDSTQSGIIVNDGDIKYNDGNLIRDAAQTNARGSGQADVLLELSTPKGGTYHVVLPDGTKVWLNAASSLKYPSRFSGNTRTVEISGEGFFEIEPDKQKPFKVISRGQEVVALGTSFNVLAYPDEVSARTTLVSGIVEVNARDQLTKELIITKRLSPSQQAVVENTSVTVNTVEIGSEIAWRHGLITFTGKPFSAIMREIARWYNLEIIYNRAIPDVALYGGINRGDNFNTVLKLLQVSEVPCRLEGRKLIIE